jgi:hypothetical protein
LRHIGEERLTREGSTEGLIGTRLEERWVAPVVRLEGVGAS